MIETKVKASSAATYLGVAALLGLLEALSVINFSGGWITAILVPIMPAAITFLTGYLARHTPRSSVQDATHRRD